MTTSQPSSQASLQVYGTSRTTIVGIVGGVASGKSIVAGILQELGGFWLRADNIGHEVLRLPEVIGAFIERWGSEVLDDQLQIDRRKIAALVFGDSAQAKENRQFLDNTTHPLIRKRLQAELDQLQNASNPPRLIILDVPLLFESQWNLACHEVLFVDTPYERRVLFAKERGWSEEELKRREASQLDINEKKRRSSFVLNNQGSVEELRLQLQQWWSRRSD